MENNVIFYYMREDSQPDYAKNGHPYGVVAFEYTNDGKVNRAISICSDEDQFNKRIGKQIALARLEAVKEKKENIEFKQYANGIFNAKYFSTRMRFMNLYFAKDNADKFYCAHYNVVPTEYEESLLENLSKTNKYN